MIVSMFFLVFTLREAAPRNIALSCVGFAVTTENAENLFSRESSTEKPIGEQRHKFWERKLEERTAETNGGFAGGENQEDNSRFKR